MKEREYGIEERLAGLVQPDTLLPSQYFDRVRRRGQYDGERRLMIAILEDAVDVYVKQSVAHDARGQQLFRPAGGPCRVCGGDVARHVEATQAREERIERVVAVIGSALVVLVFAVTTGLGLIEGVLAYAGAGALVFYLARKTFR